MGNTLFNRLAHKNADRFDFGNAKAGDDTTTKATMPLAYYKLSINGDTVIEIDAQNFIELTGGKDALAQVRKIIGV
ncbi:phage major tail tube protein [Burkholderia sp. AU45388]|uniref:phage major tail tube protein n=1 Tax=Burkholderia sp. AU45388 TaxID=3059206 RepID=UPI0026512CA6|nr:phage major tail tube protein [Burkholderia sp. AU45388]MDN7428869.1 phage major tail tube protein [Burkholderia sp. AU45388]